MNRREATTPAEGGKNPSSRPLSQRERQIVNLVALGFTNAEVADRLGIHQKTVEAHRYRIMAKMHLGSRADLVRFALEQGLLSTGPGGSFFHACGRCKVLWSLRDQLLSDREVNFLGYQTAAAPNHLGELVFRHERCGTRLRLALESFHDLSGGPLLDVSCAAAAAREDYCLAGPESVCPLTCVCAFVSRTSRVIQLWPKDRDPA